jgi:predicted phosphodiesterase
MQRIVRDIPYSCEIVFAGDTHWGSHFTHEQGIDQLIDYVGSKRNRFLIHMGDWIEAITVDDSRFDPITTKVPIPIEQAHQITRKFYPIRKRMITGLRGNHERKVHRVADLAKLICHDLDIPYGTDEARVIFTYKDEPLFNAFIAHGGKLFNSNAKDFEQQQANRKAALKLYLQNKMGDAAVNIVGHCHWLAVVPPSKRLYLVDGVKNMKQRYLEGDMRPGGYINPDQKWYGASGSFYLRYKDGMSSYGLFDPNELGFLTLIIQNGRIVELREIVI